MKQTAGKSLIRRRPVQQRAQITVEAMLDAAVQLLKRGGASSITTNRIAETAGVSIGSVYQYFPDKRAIFVALHERHIVQVDRVIERRIAESREQTLEGLIASLIDGMIETHTDPELSDLLQSEVPHHPEGARDFSVRLHTIFRSALTAHTQQFGRQLDLDTRILVVSSMLEALGHAAALRRPPGCSLPRAKRETLLAILSYLQS